MASTCLPLYELCRPELEPHAPDAPWQPLTANAMPHLACTCLDVDHLWVSKSLRMLLPYTQSIQNHLKQFHRNCSSCGLCLSTVTLHIHGYVDMYDYICTYIYIHASQLNQLVTNVIATWGLDELRPDVLPRRTAPVTLLWGLLSGRRQSKDGPQHFCHQEYTLKMWW